MKAIRSYSVRVIGTGFVVLVLLSLPLFCLRWFCKAALAVRMPSETRHVYIRPSGVVPEELEMDPNVVAGSSVFGYMQAESSVFNALTDYFMARGPGGNRSNILYYDEKRGNFLYFDKKSGLLFHRNTYEMRMIPDNELVRQKVELYAGPEGVSETPDKTLGRFVEPVLGRRYDRSKTFLYDRRQRRFFAIDFDGRIVTKGLELGKDDPREPTQIGLLQKNEELLSLNWSPPMALKLSKEEEDALRKEYALLKEYEKKGGPPAYVGPPGYDPTGCERPSGYWDLKNSFRGREKVPRIQEYLPFGGDEYILVLDKSGRIELLDRETLEFAGTAGHLPAPETLFASVESLGVIRARDLLAYIVHPVAFRPDGEYRGMIAAGLSREGTSMRVAVFDEKGKIVRFEDSGTKAGAVRPRPSISSSKSVFFERPWGPALMIGKYVLENLQSPILGIGSYFTASSFEAGSGHRALFLLPNSFIGMLGRQVDEDSIWKFSRGALLILPSIMLSIFLAVRVVRGAAKVGLSEDARLWWMIGTLCFGLTAYITYRLTKPKDVLVTCMNCGRLRRPDMDMCHHCGSKWVVGELTPPSWRVVDEQD